MAHVSLRKIVLASAVAAVIALMSLGTVGCAPKTADLSETGSGSQAEADENAAMTGDFAFSADADCTTCHSTEGDSLGDATMPASNHATQECTTCHSDIDSLATAHDGVQFGDKAPKRLKKTTIDTTACFSSGCHGSQEDLAAKTEACAILTDANGTVVNPHALPENEDHTTIDCGSCHSMHSDDTIEDTAKKACKGCHHMDVYECNTCHE